MTVLYADDDPEDRDLFADALKEISPDTKLVLVNHGKEALQHLRKDSQLPDYIFLDINMPVMGGYDCLMEIKALKHVQHIPVIMYSTNNSKLDLQKYLALGAAAYVIKEPSFQGIKNSLKKVFPARNNS